MRVEVPGRIGVIGGGTVGHATARCFHEWADVRVYDTDPTRRTHTLVEALDAKETSKSGIIIPDTAK